MPDKITDQTTVDEQPQAQEPERHTDTDETPQESTTDDQPTTEEVADAVKAIEDASEDSDEDDDADTDEDADDDAAGDEAWRRKLRRKNREAKNLRDRALTAEAELAKYKVAAQTGLPPELAVRLQGTTVDELKADAAKLLELVGPKKHYRTPGAPPATGDRQGSFRATPETETDLGKIGSRIYER